MAKSMAFMAPLRFCKCGSGCVKNGGASAARPTTHVNGLHRVTVTSAEPRGAIWKSAGSLTTWTKRASLMMIWSWTMLPALPSMRVRKERPKHIWESCGNRHRAHHHHFYQQQEVSLWLKINLLSKRYSMMKMETLCFVKITVRHEKSTRAQVSGWFWLCRTFWQGSNESYHWDHWTLTPTTISYSPPQQQSSAAQHE